MKRTIFGTALAMLLALAGSASAQNFPDRQVTMVIPFAAGGPQDVTVYEVDGVTGRAAEVSVG